jgi:predicted naringenin-chalcone synthase
MNKEIFIHSFQSVLPPNHLPQNQIVEWVLKSHERCESLKGPIDDPEKFLQAMRRFSLNENHISQRYFDCNEVDEAWEDHEIYKLTEESPDGASIETRNLYFGKKVERVFSELYETRTPAHIVHVTCTGYLSPSPAQSYFSNKAQTPGITHAYHMGCYASLPSIRTAMGLYVLQEKDVDVVHTEMCSLHLHPGVHTPEQMVVQTLFGDGHIKYSIGEQQSGMKILSIQEKLIPDSNNDMTWIPSSFGMKMTLSREVPFKIRDSLPEFIRELCLKANVSREEIFSKGIFAIHPGGPKIIEAVQKKLELKDEQVKMSQKVLFERGNMSSATLPHVWHEILKSKPVNGTKVLSLAFGPGLTIFGSIFEVQL